PAASLPDVLRALEARYGMEIPGCLFAHRQAPGEAVVRGTIAAVRRELSGWGRRTGQVLAVLAPAPRGELPNGSATETRLLRTLLDEGVPLPAVARAAAAAWGWNRH